MTRQAAIDVARGRAQRADSGRLVVTGWLSLADLHPTGDADGNTLPITFLDTWRKDGGRVRVVHDFRRWRAIGRVRTREPGART